MAESEDEGRCIDCGFLGKRVLEHGPRAIAPAYYEIDHRGRETGDVFGCVQDSLVGTVPAEPFCFLQAASIKDEIDLLDKTASFSSRAQQVFAKDRNCRSWYRYNPGLGPKDHFDVMNMELLEKARRDFELRLEKDRKEFDLKLFEISQKIQEDSRKIATRSFWFNLFFTFVIILLTLVQIFLALDWGRATFREWIDQLGHLVIRKSSGG